MPQLPWSFQLDTLLFTSGNASSRYGCTSSLHIQSLVSPSAPPHLCFAEGCESSSQSSEKIWLDAEYGDVVAMLSCYRLHANTLLRLRLQSQDCSEQQPEARKKERLSKQGWAEGASYVSEPDAGNTNVHAEAGRCYAALGAGRRSSRGGATRNRRDRLGWRANAALTAASRRRAPWLSA